jgi:dolichyl-phosphate-mannose-protein mannosyltransferase
VTAARCYLQHLPFRTTHLTLVSLLIALSIRICGDQPSSWRLPGATVGTALVGITYLLGRRMFNSRPAAALAAVFVICDGLFFVDSRIALWENFYLTSAAFAYLMFFHFVRARDPKVQRRALAWMGLALGLGLDSKFLIPVATEILLFCFVIFILVRVSRARSVADEPVRPNYRGDGITRRL